MTGRIRGATACIAATLAASLACSPADEGRGAAAEGSGDVVEVELFDSTVVLDPATLGSLTASDPDGTLRFDGAPTGLEAVERGSVLLGDPTTVAPSGLLRLVTGVDRDALGIAVHTVPALPQLAFRHLVVQATRTISPDAAHAGLAPLASGSAYPGEPLDEFVFNGDGDPTTLDDQVHLGGNLAAGISYTFGLSTDWSDVTGSLDEAVGCALSFFTSCDPLEILPEITGGFAFSAGAEAELRLDGTAFLDFEKPVTLPKVKFEPIGLGPLWFFPELEVRADIEGDASSAFEVGASVEAHAKAGLTYSSREGGSLQPPDVSAPTFQVLAASPGLGAHARVRVGPRLSIKLYDVLGPFASVYAFAELYTDRTRTPCYSLTAGLEGDVGITLALEEGGLHLGLPPYSRDFDIASEVVDDGACPPLPGGEPGGPADVLANPTFTPWATTVGDVLLHFPFEDAGAQVEWTELAPTIDGRWLVAGSATDALVKLDRDGAILWTRRYSLPEAWNDVDSQRAVLPSRSIALADGGSVVAAFPYTLLAVDDQGAVRWAKQLALPISERMLRITGLVALPGGGFVATGNVADATPATFEEVDAFAAWFTSDGTLLRFSRIGDAGLGETARSLVPFGDGAVLLGSTWDPAGAFFRGFLVRFGAAGEIEWSRSLAVTESAMEARTFLLSGFAAKDGDLVVAGTADVRSRASTLVAKVKPDGSLGWATVQDVPDAYVGVTLTGVAPLPTSGMVATGRFSLRNASDLWFAGLDSIGRVQWMRRVGRAGGGGPLGTDPGDHNAPGLAVGVDGGVIVAGYTQGLAPGATTEGLLAFEAYAKDGTLAIPDDRVALTDATATTVSLDAAVTTAWAPAVRDVDVTIRDVPLSVDAPSSPVTRLAP